MIRRSTSKPLARLGLIDQVLAFQFYSPSEREKRLYEAAFEGSERYLHRSLIEAGCLLYELRRYGLVEDIPDPISELAPYLLSLYKFRLEGIEWEATN